MPAPVQSGPFSVLAFKPFVPRKVQPWIYLFFAACFQLSGGRYLSALNYMMGEEQLMREDLMMCLYCNLAGMATYFPLFFRMKFRFTNKTLIRAAAIGVLVCNLLIPYINFLPLLWALCFIEGVCKLQGTFESISTVQLWITPQRDFRVFFPVLHIFILGMLNLFNWLTCYYAFGWDDWRLSHYTIAGLMLIILLILTTCERHARFIPKTPLYGIDWVGYVSWNALLFQVVYLLDYGDWMDWTNSPTFWTLLGTIMITFGFILYGTIIKPHAYISRKIFKFDHVISILFLITAYEILMSCENVLEEAFIEGGMHYSEWQASTRYLVAFLGIVSGSGFSYWWLKIHAWSYTRLGIVAAFASALYMMQMYYLAAPGVNIQQIYLPVFCRAFATCTFSITFMTLLNYSMDFHTFFQGLSVFNMIHMMVGGCFGGAIFTKIFESATQDAALKSAAYPLIAGVRSTYGIAIYGAFALIFLFLIYDMPLRRHQQHLRRIMPWRKVGYMFLSPFVGKK